METKKQKQEKIKEACRKIKLEIIFSKNTVYFYSVINRIEIATAYYSGNKITRLDSNYRASWQQEKYNQIFNIIQEINEN